jgi:hypothetical protein
MTWPSLGGGRPLCGPRVALLGLGKVAPVGSGALESAACACTAPLKGYTCVTFWLLHPFCLPGHEHDLCTSLSLNL